MPLHRNKKFVRSKQPPNRLRIQPRDVELLRDVADYRFLDTREILSLQGGGERNLKRRLASLYHLGYLERPESQKLFPKTGSFLIYSIGDQGAELLSRKELAGNKSKEVAYPNLLHAMMLSYFHCTLSLALKGRSPETKLTRWTQGYELKDELSSRGEKTELVPDAFFTIEDKGDLLPFFLEVDRSTMTQERFVKKMRIYWKWWREERCEKTLGIEKFRVLTITPSKERAENLRRATKRADDRKQGSNMFLFLSEKEYSLKNPEAVLSPLWLSPKDETKHSILE